MTSQTRHVRSGWTAQEWGEIALLALAATAWLLVLLAQAGWFRVAWLAVAPLAVALAAAALAWWRSQIFSRLAALAIVAVAALLYLPGAQQVALSGDAAIYPNEGAWLARTGKLTNQHPALAALSPESADLFFVNSEEQFSWDQTVAAYDGLVYGGYYLAAEGGNGFTGTLQSSRMPQVIAWHGLLHLLFTWDALLFVTSALFAIGALVLLYATGALLYGRWIALWAALLLGICYPQIYLARGSLAEMTGAFWSLAGIWLAVRWLHEKQPRLLLFALFMWITSWSARVDALLLLAPVAILIAIAAAHRDRAALKWLAFAALPFAALILLGTNSAYFLATIQLSTSYIFLLTPALILLAVGAPLLAAIMWRWGAPLASAWQRVERPVLLVAWLVIAAVVAWATVPGPWRDYTITRPFQEIIWYSSLYISPIFYWLAVLGIGVLFWRGLTPTSLFLVGTLLVLAVAYLHGYTSANVYPISLRRLASDLLPLMALTAGFALAIDLSRWLQAPLRQGVAAAVAMLALVWVGVLAAPVIAQREHPNDLAFVRALHESLPADSALLFEPQDDDSWVGWLAAPLYSFYGDWALLLQSDAPDPQLLAEAVRQLAAAGRTVHIVSQSSPLPTALLPAGMQAVEADRRVWESAMLGQARPPDEPIYWEFSLPLHLYRLEATP